MAKPKRKYVRRNTINLNLWDIFPKETRDRIVDHCRRENTTPTDFLKRAVYSTLPVHYEVNKQFVFPFGKYSGETAETVKRIDPGYIDWAKKSITGFKVQEDLEPIVPHQEAEFRPQTVLTQFLFTYLKPGEFLVVNRRSAWGRNKATDKWRKIATRMDADNPVWNLHY